MSFKIESRDDTEVVASAAESPVEVWRRGLVDLSNSAICEDEFEVPDVVRCPAVALCNVTYAAFLFINKGLEIFWGENVRVTNHPKETPQHQFDYSSLQLQSFPMARE